MMMWRAVLTALLLALASPALGQISGVFPGATVLNPGTVTLGSSITPTTTGLYAADSVTGTCTSHPCPINAIVITNDTADASNGGNVEGWNVTYTFGGSSARGNRIAIVGQNAITSPSGNTGGQSYAGGAFYFNAASNDGGIDLGTNAVGNLQGINTIVTMTSAATFWRNMQAAEFDANVNTGASIKNKMGIQIAQLATDNVGGAVLDAALMVGNQVGAVGWKQGIVFGGGDGIWPFTTSGVGITCLNCGTLDSFADMSGATISTNFLKGPGGYAVKGTGVVDISSTTTPTVASGHLLLSGSAVAPTMATTGGAIYLRPGNGLQVQGQGTANDIVLLNKNGGAALYIPTGTLNIVQPGFVSIGSATVPTAITGELAQAKIGASGSAPGAGFVKMSWVTGTNVGSCKLIAYAGTSATPSTIIDNVGAGC